MFEIFKALTKDKRLHNSRREFLYWPGNERSYDVLDGFRAVSSSHFQLVRPLPHKNLPGWRASQQQAMSAGQASDHLRSCEAAIFQGSALSSAPSKRLCNATRRGGKAKQSQNKARNLQAVCSTLVVLLRCFRRLATAPDAKVMLCLAAVSFVVLNAVTFIYNKTSRLKTKISQGQAQDTQVSLRFHPILSKLSTSDQWIL